MINSALLKLEFIFFSQVKTVLIFYQIQKWFHFNTERNQLTVVFVKQKAKGRALRKEKDHPEYFRDLRGSKWTITSWPEGPPLFLVLWSLSLTLQPDVADCRVWICCWWMWRTSLLGSVPAFNWSYKKTHRSFQSIRI